MCDRCRGTGFRTYSNTSTWMHGLGGQMMTEDVCDKCWGSGDEKVPGENLRLRAYRERGLLNEED